MPDIEIPLTDEILNNNFQKMLYLPASLQVFIWHDNKPIVVPVDLASMTKTAKNLETVFNGNVDDETRQELISIMSKGLTPYFKYGNNHGITEAYRKALDEAINKPKLAHDLGEEFAKEIPNKEYSEFVISTIKKEVKREDVLIRQIFYVGMSAYTSEPLNLAISAPTSEGKSYAVRHVLDLFPEADVWSIGGISDKALIRQKGILINSKGESIQDQVDELREEQRKLKTTPVRLMFEAPNIEKDREENNPKPKLNLKEKRDQKIAEVQKKLDTLLDGASTLINFQGKILEFLEPPGKGVLEIIKPILSHDKVEISFPYSARNEHSGEWVARNVIVRGWPAVIYCSAKDESDWNVWPEIQSRFLITSPNMSEDKVYEGNMLIAQKNSLPDSIQQQIIVSDKDQELAKKCILYIKDWIRRLSDSNGWDYKRRNKNWIPYYDILASALKADRGTDNRATSRIFTFLKVIPLVKSHLRQTLVYGKERLPIATLDDLSETLHITQNMSGIPTHKLKFYRDIIVELYESKGDILDSKGDNVEDRQGVTTSQICEYYKKKTGRVINSDSVRKTFINELMNNGWMDSQDSALDKRQKIYWPIIEIPKEENIKEYRKIDDSRNFLQHSPIIPSKNFKEIPENWLELAISFLEKNRNQLDFQLIDSEGDEMSILKFVKSYPQKASLFLYFQKAKSCNYYSGIFGKMKELHSQEPKDIENCGNAPESRNSLFSDWESGLESAPGEDEDSPLKEDLE
jgi:hypothetical protein